MIHKPPRILLHMVGYVDENLLVGEVYIFLFKHLFSNAYYILDTSFIIQYKTMREIYVVLILFLEVCAEEEVKHVEITPNCMRHLTGKSGNISYPGFKFNDGKWNFYTEYLPMDGLCLLYGEIPPTKDLMIFLGVGNYRWIHIGGKEDQNSDWKNIDIIQPSQHKRVEGEKHSKNVMVSGYDYGYFRIVFPKKDADFSLSYEFKNHQYTHCPHSNVFDIVSCTNGNKINSKCKVKCKNGLATSPMLYINTPNISKSILPYMITTCRSNGLNPPTWDPDITIKSFIREEPDRFNNPRMPTMLFKIPTYPEIQLLPSFFDDEAGVDTWTNRLNENIDQTVEMLHVEDPNKCVALDIVSDLCFYYDERVTIMDGITGLLLKYGGYNDQGCVYPADYLLELFGETEGRGIDPDTLPIKPPPSLGERILKLTKRQKVLFATKLQNLKYVGQCWRENARPLLRQLRRQTKNVQKVKNKKMIRIVDNIWKEYNYEFLLNCGLINKLELPTNPSKPNCLRDERLCEWDTKSNSYRFGCTDFEGGKRIRQCLTCRYPKPGKCEKLKASG